MSSNVVQNVSRKSFLTGIATGALGLTAASSVSAALADEPASDAAWDAEYDVVVLGYGAGGAATAITACDEGASVLICEKAPEGHEGGGGKYAGQAVMATNDPERLATYIKKMSTQNFHVNIDEEMIDVFAQGAYDTFHWFVDDLGADIDGIWPSTPELLEGRTYDYFSDDPEAKRGYVPVSNFCGTWPPAPALTGRG